MTEVMGTIHRRDDGTIDTDLYRHRSRDLRAAALRAVLVPARGLSVTLLTLFGPTVTLQALAGDAEDAESAA